jgi:glycosyltransferase involved in cell wall biosynthesis
MGIEKSSGKYIAFCDDDDIWFPYKTELQLNAMKRTGCKMSSTDGLFGFGVYDNNKLYKKYNEEAHIDILKGMYKDSKLLDNGFPEIWNKDFIEIHNCIICSSVIMEKEILNIINNMRYIHMNNIIPEDYDCWLRALEHTDSVYIKEACFYYDGGHGYGQNR